MELVALVVEKLWDRLSKEYETFKGVEGQVTELKSNLNLLKSFLKDAYAKRHTNEMVRHCVEEIKEIVYDAEDIIETCIIKNIVENKSGIIKRIGRFASTIVDRRELASDIGGITNRISKVIQDMQSFGVQQMIIDGSWSQHPLQEKQREMRQEFAKSSESNLVGLKTSVKKLVRCLEKEDEIQIICVTGMGGLGKTTLARQVFNHEDVKRQQFVGLAWVCVSQDFTRKNIWQKILGGLKPKEEEEKILRMAESTLQDELFQLLNASKSLIVLDDIWRKEDWDLIKPIFPPTKEYKCDKKIMEELGEQMIKHCGGLPLAIKVLGGLLAENYTLHDWKRLSENIGSHLVAVKADNNDDQGNSCNYVLSLSFEELPSYLKHCFLYLAHFPEDHTITVRKLSFLWAAEGIYDPRRNNGENIRDVGDSYIEELVRRNMVIAERSEAMRYDTCQLHDMMREVCLFKAKEENFLQFISSQPPTSNFQSSITSRRCVSHNPSTIHVERDLNNPKLRSLVVVQVKEDWQNRWKLSSSSYTKLELLRVLDLSKADFGGKRLASRIGKLIHLRYLSLEDATVSHLPYSLGDLKLLIYLNLEIVGTIFVPNVLMGMKELRYLALPMLMHRKTKLELSNQVNLETLMNFSTKNSNLEDIRGMVKLRTLTIQLTEETISTSIGGLQHLENLDIWFKRRIEDEIVFDFSRLKRLCIRELPRLPKEQHFPSSLTVLTLFSCCLEEDPMPVLEKLVQLKVIRLYNKSFIGRKMVCSGGGFPKLQSLELLGLEKLEEWKVEEGSMPLLRTLYILRCPKLKELPDGLSFITDIKELRTDEKWKERLSKGRQEYYKVQHIPSVLFF